MSMKTFLRSLWRFGYEQAMSCVFPVCIFAALALSKLLPGTGLPRYDFMLLVCLAVQWVMYRSGMETKDEVKVIAVFHVIGLAMELFKVHMGSWSYPEEAYTKLFGVPLYSGFMYASVASFMCQSWRRLDLRLARWPSGYVVVPLGALVYLNFFTHHFFIDLRWWLGAAIVVVFFRTWIGFSVGSVKLRMPLALSFVLIGFFVWIAENIATYFQAWNYPHQAGGWQVVHWGKLTSWTLLVIISFMIVAQLKHVKENRQPASLSQRVQEVPAVPEDNAEGFTVK